MSTGISYALIDKATEDKLPLAMMGYGRTDAVDLSLIHIWKRARRCGWRFRWPSSS